MAQIIERKKKAADGRSTWLVRVYDGFDENGKRKYISYNVTGTKRDAEREAKRLETKRDDGALIDYSKMTVGEWLEEWLTVWAKQRVTDRTLRDYRKYLTERIVPVLGKYPLAKAQNMQKLFQETVDDISATSGGRTGQYVHMILKQALSKAVETRKIERNPLEFVQRPKAEKKQEIRPLDTHEIHAFLATVKTSWPIETGAAIYPLFHFMIDSGCRPGEAFALRWTDFDDDLKTVRIQRSLERGPDGWNEKEPKTAGSRRTIGLTTSTAAILKQYRNAQREYKMAHRQDYRDHGFVFTAANGEPLDKDNVSKRYLKSTLTRSGLSTATRLYDLRHTMATQLLKAGVNPKIVSERLGHKDIVLTLSTYSHVLPAMQEVAVNALENVLESGTYSHTKSGSHTIGTQRKRPRHVLAGRFAEKP